VEGEKPVGEDGAGDGDDADGEEAGPAGRRRNVKSDGPLQGFTQEADAGIPSIRSPARVDDDDDDGIPVIPDLEDGPGEDGVPFEATVAAAPHAQAQVMSIRELDGQMEFSLPSAAEVGVDLGILSRHLHPQDQVQEADEEWAFDPLITELAQHFREVKAEDDAREGRLAQLAKDRGDQVSARRAQIGGQRGSKARPAMEAF